MGINDISNLSSHQFEVLVMRLIKEIGFITRDRKRVADGGIDIYAENTQPIFKGSYIIQCKKYTKPVGVSYIRDLFGVIHSENANKGILITNSTFTEPAKKFAEDKPIELIDGNNLLKLLSEHDLLSRNLKGEKVGGSVFIFQRSLIKPIENILSEYNDLKNGLTFLDKKTVYPSVCENFWRNGYNNFIEYQQTMKRIFDKLFPLLQSDEKENYDEITKYSKSIVQATNKMLKDYKKGMKLLPPDRENYIEKNNNFLKIYDNIFEEWEKFVINFNNQLEESYNNERLFLMFDFSKANNTLGDIKKEIGYILGIKFNFWDASLKEKLGYIIIILIFLILTVPFLYFFSIFI